MNAKLNPWVIRLPFSLLALFGWLFCVPLIGLAQSATSGDEARASVYLSVDKLTPGSSFRVAVVVELAEHWHVNANPVSMNDLIPTTLTLQSIPSIIIDRIVYPRGVRTRVGWADKPVALYTGRVVIFAEGRVGVDAQPGPLKLAGSLRFQACDNQVCRAPKVIPIAIETEIADVTYKPQSQHPEIFSAAPIAKATPLATAPIETRNAIERLIQERGWLIAFVFVFLGGLALNLTPCVYPMIAITVSYFGGQGERTMRRAFLHAYTYFLGIVLTYSTLGLVAAMTGGLFGAFLQSPVVLIVIATLLVVLALSMLGLYEIQPPQALMQKAAGLSSKAGYVGVFFLGASVGVIAAPCLAPILVALLVFVGQRGDPVIGWWMFFTLAVGLGLPYVILGTFSGLLARLPKSGLWMVWVKRAFGVLLIGVAAWITNPLWLSTASRSGITWEPYSPAKLQQAAATHRPVIIDFYADWCIPCKEMERTTYAIHPVIEKSRSFLMLKADLTHTGASAVKKLQDDFSILGVPTTVFIGADGNERGDLRLIGFVGPKPFLDVMDKVLSTVPTKQSPAK